MGDFLVRLGENKTMSALVRGLGLPVPLPQQLERSSEPWKPRFLSSRTVFVGAVAGDAADLVHTVQEAGAEVWAVGLSSAPEGAKAFEPGQPPEDIRPHALVFDARAAATPEDLDALYAFFRPLIRGLAPCGRVVVVARTPEEVGDPAARATHRAVDGFVRSVGREIGRQGSTAQTLYMDENAADRLPPVLRFLLSTRSAYLSGQPFHVSAVAANPTPPAYERPLEGKVAVVTGAAQGIGAATARSLAREGTHVIVADRPDALSEAEAVAKEIGGTAIACDIADADAARILRDAVSAQGGKLDIVVHNAGVTRDKTLRNMDEARWDLVLEVNLRALIRLNEALLEDLADGGRIVCLSSIGGIAGNMGQTNYAATKAGVIGYVQGLAPLLAERGITVNAVAPGFIETRMTAAIPLATREVARRLCNLSQGGQPEDIAETVTFLASPGAAGLTGTVVRVCGGNFIGA